MSIFCIKRDSAIGKAINNPAELLLKQTASIHAMAKISRQTSFEVPRSMNA
jgi:hypothetical protein